MKQQIRYFSIGLLTASLIILSFVSFFDKSDASANGNSIDEMIEKIKADGYHVLSASDYISLTVQADNDDSNTDTETDDKEDALDEAGQSGDGEIITYTLTVVPNMLGPTISKLLQENKIIDDADEFNRYLETEGHAPYIQLGDHELSSDMSYFELAKKIAR